MTAEDLRAIRGLVGPFKLQRGNLNGRLLDERLKDGPADFTEAQWAELDAVR